MNFLSFCFNHLQVGHILSLCKKNLGLEALYTEAGDTIRSDMTFFLVRPSNQITK